MTPLPSNTSNQETNTTTRGTQIPTQTTNAQYQDIVMDEAAQGRASAAAKPSKTCFVTIGATASFNALIEAVLHDKFLGALIADDYTELLLQHGKEGGEYLDWFERDEDTGEIDYFGLKIHGFKYNKRGLGAEMLTTKGADGRQEGVVISHAGTAALLQESSFLELTLEYRIRNHTRCYAY